MKLFKASQIRELDQFTIVNEPISSIELMERASIKLFRVFKMRYKRQSNVIVFAGPGNNGGDGLALARLLLNDDYNVQVFLCTKPDKLSPDCRSNYDRLNSIGADISIASTKNLPELSNKIVVDALFGSGLSRKADGIFGDIIQHINNSNCEVFSIDIPSGLFCESNIHNEADHIIKANLTVTFQVPKLAFFFAENEKFTGKIRIEDIGLMKEAIEKTETPFSILDQHYISSIYAEPLKFSHKGTKGHALLISGSQGKMGASVLASKGCLRAGIGLLTTHVPCCGYPILQNTVPEAMASIDRTEFHISGIPELDTFNAIGVGPGIGIKTNTQLMLKDLLTRCKIPIVIDADGLNIISKDKSLLELLPDNCILTPHPGEFERLFGSFTDGFERTLKQIELSMSLKCVIVLKGAHTSITTPQGKCYFNSTGNPGLATAGSGDVLTGILVSLLAQGYAADQAALMGVWLHGKAADIYLEEHSMESLISSDICLYLGKAFKTLNEERTTNIYF